MADLNRFLKNVLIFLIIVFIVYFLPKINETILHHFDNIAVRAFCIGVILYTGMDDPIIALLLSVCFVMMHTKLQELKNMNMKNMTDTVGKNYNIGSDIDMDSEPDLDDVVSEPDMDSNNSIITSYNSENKYETISDNDESQYTNNSVLEEEEENRTSVSEYDPQDSIYEDNLDEELVENTGDTFAELKPYLKLTDITESVDPYDKQDTLKPINTKSAPLNNDNNRLEKYNRFKVSQVTLPLS